MVIGMVNRIKFLASAGAFVVSVMVATVPVEAQVTPFNQALAQAAQKDKEIAAFYKARGYKPIWTSNADKQRRKAFLKASEQADLHGLPSGAYSPERIKKLLKSARDGAERGRVEFELSRMFLDYAQDIQSGILVPRRVVEGVERRTPRRDELDLLNALSKSSPNAFFKSLAPSTPEYARLMEEKLRLEKIIGGRGWGPKVKTNRKIEPGAQGPSVVAVRNRLIAKGYLKRTASQTYEGEMVVAMKLFQ